MNQRSIDSALYMVWHYLTLSTALDVLIETSALDMIEVIIIELDCVL